MNHKLVLSNQWRCLITVTYNTLKKTKAHAYENLKNRSKAAVVVADVPSHTNVRIKGTAHIHEDDDYQKRIATEGGAPAAYVVDIDIEEIYE